MEKLRASFEFIFSSYKRIAALLILGAVVLAVPITLSLLGQQQDIRQRAEDFDDDDSTTVQTVSEEALRSFCDRCLSDDEEFACGRIRDGRLRVECREEMSSSFGLCISCKNLPTPTCTPRPACLDAEPRCLPPEPIGGWCPAPTSTPKSEDNVCLSVMTWARNTTTQECREFPSSCLPDGWTADTSCSSTPIPVCKPVPPGCTLLVDGGAECPSGGEVPPRMMPGPPDGWCPIPSCTPRPACLDSNPPCLPPVPPGGWCPIPLTPTISATPSPTQTGQARYSISLSLQLTGIGSGSAKIQNNNPTRPQRRAEVQIYNSQHERLAQASGTVNYEASRGFYKGTVDLASNFQLGAYLVKVRMDNTLWRTIPGIQNITAQTSTQILTTQLITGDVNQDNEINLLDYNLLISCLDKDTCDNKMLADLNDDGKVEEKDLNVLLSGFSKRIGD